jgi:hypothetical protein
LGELSASLGDWTAPPTWGTYAREEKAVWDAHVDGLRAGVAPEGELTYAQVVGIVNDASGPDDYVLSASGGMPGELHGGWRTGDATPSVTSGATMDLEYGFSCMGYEVVAPWGAAMARATTHPGGLVTALFGDGSYLMLNSELYSAAFAGHPYVAVLCDNGGFAVIHRLQTNQGADGFNNMLADSRGSGSDGSIVVDFAHSAAALRTSLWGRMPTRSGRRTSGLANARSPSADPWSSSAARTRPPGQRPEPGGRPVSRNRSPVTRRTTKARDGSFAGSCDLKAALTDGTSWYRPCAVIASTSLLWTCDHRSHHADGHAEGGVDHGVTYRWACGLPARELSDQERKVRHLDQGPCRSCATPYIRR